MSTQNRSNASSIPKYLGPPDDSLMKKLPECALPSKLKYKFNDDKEYIYYDFFPDIKALHAEWKESLYEKIPDIDDFFSD